MGTFPSFPATNCHSFLSPNAWIVSTVGYREHGLEGRTPPWGFSSTLRHFSEPQFHHVRRENLNPKVPNPPRACEDQTRYCVWRHVGYGFMLLLPEGSLGLQSLQHLALRNSMIWVWFSKPERSVETAGSRFGISTLFHCRMGERASEAPLS